MKQFVSRILACLVLIVAGLAFSAHAQAMPAIKVTIPFAFTFGNHSFPAGDYTVVQLTTQALALRDARGYVIAQALTRSIDHHAPVANPKLRFYVSGDQHILAEVWGRSDFSDRHLNGAPDLANIEKHRLVQSEMAAGAGHDRSSEGSMQGSN